MAVRDPLPTTERAASHARVCRLYDEARALLRDVTPRGSELAIAKLREADAAWTAHSDRYLRPPKA